jgi:hypothetical protein
VLDALAFFVEYVNPDVMVADVFGLVEVVDADDVEGCAFEGFGLDAVGGGVVLAGGFGEAVVVFLEPWFCHGGVLSLAIVTCET